MLRHSSMSREDFPYLFGITKLKLESEMPYMGFLIKLANLEV